MKAKRVLKHIIITIIYVYQLIISLYGLYYIYIYIILYMVYILLQMYNFMYSRMLFVFRIKIKQNIVID